MLEGHLPKRKAEPSWGIKDYLFDAGETDFGESVFDFKDFFLFLAGP